MPRTELFAQWLGGRLVINNQLLTTGKIWFVSSGTGTNALNASGIIKPAVDS